MVAQHAHDRASAGGRFPDAMRHLLNAKQRLDGDAWCLLQIQAALGVRVALHLTGMIQSHHSLALFAGIAKAASCVVAKTPTLISAALNASNPALPPEKLKTASRGSAALSPL